MSTIKAANIQNPSAASAAIVLDTSGNFSVPAGTVSAPGIQAPSDSNTGIFFPAADTIAFAEGGTEAMRIDSSSRLLVGTSSTRTIGFWDTPQFLFEGTDYQKSSLCIYNNQNDIYGAVISLGHSRGTSVGSNTIVQNNDYLGALAFHGSDGGNEVRAAEITAYVDGTPGVNDMPCRLVFSTTADGASSPTERMRIQQNGAFTNCLGIYNDTTGAAANMVVNSSGSLQRSTSSAKYKTDIETLEDQYADALLDCRPVWYRSTCTADNPTWGWWGLIAEEVAEIDPRLVHWKTTEPVVQENGSIENIPCEPEPEGVAYDRFVPHLLNLIKRQKEQIESQGAAITALEARLSALEGA